MIFDGFFLNILLTLFERYIWDLKPVVTMSLHKPTLFPLIDRYYPPIAQFVFSLKFSCFPQVKRNEVIWGQAYKVCFSGENTLAFNSLCLGTIIY